MGIEQVSAALAHGEWKAGELHAIDPAHLSAQRCVGGTQEGIDTIVCEYGGVEAVRRGQKAVETWIAGAVTGVALTNGRTVLGLADRSRADPKGKTIHAISKTYLAIK